jgi:hypothetical protein
MRSTKIALSAVLLMVVGSTAFGLDGIKGEYRPNLHNSSPNAIGDIKGEYRPNVYSDSRNAIGDIKGEYTPSSGSGSPSPYDGVNGEYRPSWLNLFDFLFGD